MLIHVPLLALVSIHDGCYLLHQSNSEFLMRDESK